MTDDRLAPAKPEVRPNLRRALIAVLIPSTAMLQAGPQEEPEMEMVLVALYWVLGNWFQLLILLLVCGIIVRLWLLPLLPVTQDLVWSR